jgi:peroxiredoxin
MLTWNIMRKILCTLICAATLVTAQGPRRAPGFALPDVKGDVKDLNDYRGKVVVLEFMQTTCPHCADFVAKLKDIQQKYGDKVQILSVVFPPDDQNAVKQYIAGHGISYPVLFDCGQMGYSYIRKQTVDFPHVYLIDRNGMIRNDWVQTPTTMDIFEGNGLAAEIDRMLTNGTPTAPKKP